MQNNLFSTEEHWHFFSEFCRYEKAAGGPDPQIPLVGEMSKGEPWEERVWRAGVYISVYNVPFAEVLWREWPRKRMQRESAQLLPWLQEHWGGITTRVERRCVRRPEWMEEFLLGYQKFAHQLPFEMAIRTGMDSRRRYLAFWELALRVPRLGRYVALKLLESYKRYCEIELEAPDIRPRDAWSPRTTLAHLFPEHAELLTNNNNDTASLNVVNAIVEQARGRLAAEAGLDINLFDFQVLLCEYRESFEGKRQYPGRSHDSELGYWHKARKYWGLESNMFGAREAIFPEEHLGEKHGWKGPRKALGRVLSEHRYTWSDLIYNYAAMAADGNFAAPAWRKGVEGLRNRAGETLSIGADTPIVAA